MNGEDLLFIEDMARALFESDDADYQYIKAKLIRAYDVGLIEGSIQARKQTVERLEKVLKQGQ